MAMTEANNRNKSLFGRSRGQIATSIVMVIVVLFCFFVAMQLVIQGYVSFFGRSVFRVVTGSMEPSIHVGELIICEKTDFYSIEENDIVCYISQTSNMRGAVITHRVVATGLNGEGEYCLQTQGDANLSTDPFFVKESNFLGKVIWQSGNEGIFTKLISFITGKIGFLACIVVPLVVIAGIVLKNSAKNLYKSIDKVQKEIKKEEELGQKLPGYSTLTYRDYEELRNSIVSSLVKEFSASNVNEETGCSKDKTEYNESVSKIGHESEENSSKEN